MINCEHPIYIIGGGGHAVSVASALLSNGLEPCSFICDTSVGNHILGVPVIDSHAQIGHDEPNFFIAVGDNFTRKKIYHVYREKFPNAKFPRFIHQSSLVGCGVSVGDAAVVMPRVFIGPRSVIGDGCLINTGTIIEHDCVIDPFSSIAPGVCCGGRVHLGALSALGIGANIKHGITIGPETVVGASSYVNKDIQNNVVAYGVPCRIINPRKAEDAYL